MTVLTRDTWTTRDGQSIKIERMASSHLLHTIHMIERNRLMNAAEKYGEGDIDLASYYMQWPPQYEEMIKEAQKRNLIARSGLVAVQVKRIK